MRILCTLLMIFFSAEFSFAKADAVKYQPDAYNVCNERVAGSARLNCLNVIANKTYSKQNLLFCRDSSNTSEVIINCLQEMNLKGDRNFQPEAFNVCNERVAGSARLNCLNVIANKTYSKQNLLFCRDSSNTSEVKINCLQEMNLKGDRNFQPEAFNVCNERVAGSARLNCLNVIANKTYSKQNLLFCRDSSNTSEVKINCLQEMNLKGDRNFQPEAFNVCNERVAGSARLNCLNVIANKTYDTQQLSLCKESSEETIECLKNLSSKQTPSVSKNTTTITNDVKHQPDAYNTCTKVTDSSMKKDCFNVIANKTYSNQNAFFCKYMKTNQGIVNCFKDANSKGNRIFDKAALDACNWVATDPERLECLNLIANRNYPDQSVEILSNQGSTYKQVFTGLHAHFCAGMKTGNAILNCFKELNSHGNKTFHAYAVYVCNFVNHDSYRMDCFNTIANRTYSNELLSFCWEMKTIPGVINCFKKANDKVNRTFQIEALAYCGRIVDDPARLACFDKLPAGYTQLVFSALPPNIKQNEKIAPKSMDNQTQSPIANQTQKPPPEPVEKIVFKSQPLVTQNQCDFSSLNLADQSKIPGKTTVYILLGFLDDPEKQMTESIHPGILFHFEQKFLSAACGMSKIVSNNPFDGVRYRKNLPDGQSIEFILVPPVHSEDELDGVNPPDLLSSRLNQYLPIADYFIYFGHSRYGKGMDILPYDSFHAKYARNIFNGNFNQTLAKYGSKQVWHFRL
jgi:surface antigen